MSPAVDGFWADGRMVIAPNGCWLWMGKRTRGYGYIYAAGKHHIAHRFVYEALVGPVPEGLDLGHRCHDLDRGCAGGDACPHRACCNPLHLEPQTRKANLAGGRGNGSETHCPHGHSYEDAYLDRRGYRDCRTCRKQRSAAYRAKRKVSSWRST